MASKHKKNIISYLKDSAWRYNLWDVFTSFTEIMAITISNAIDTRNFEKREKKYLELISRFNQREIEFLTKTFAEVILALDEEPMDVLGEIYNELQLSDKWKGQFFTPIQVCKAMGKMVLSDLEEKIKKKGYVTVHEPACGGGATIIGLIEEMRERGINYQQKLLVHCVDIDYKAVAMSYIQLSLLGVSAVIVHGDSLAQKFYDTWYTPMYIINGWEQRLRSEEIIEKLKSVVEKGMAS